MAKLSKFINPDYGKDDHSYKSDDRELTAREKALALAGTVAVVAGLGVAGASDAEKEQKDADYWNNIQNGPGFSEVQDVGNISNTSDTYDQMRQTGSIDVPLPPISEETK